MRALLTALALAALAGCGPSAPPAAAPNGQAGAPAQQAGAVTFDSFRNLPDWLFILRTNEGGTIHYNQRTVTRENGLADIWVQIHWGHQQLFETESRNRQTAIHYELERVHYRFNCAEEKFAIVERQYLGANETVVATQTPLLVFRAIPETGAAIRIQPIACRGH